MIKVKEAISYTLSILAILAAIGTYGTMRAKNAVLSETVRKHEELLSAYNIPVMNERMKNISDDMKELKILLTDFIKEYNKHQ